MTWHYIIGALVFGATLNKSTSTKINRLTWKKHKQTNKQKNGFLSQWMPTLLVTLKCFEKNWKELIIDMTLFDRNTNFYYVFIWTGTPFHQNNLWICFCFGLSRVRKKAINVILLGEKKKQIHKLNGFKYESDKFTIRTLWCVCSVYNKYIWRS